MSEIIKTEKKDVTLNIVEDNITVRIILPNTEYLYVAVDRRGNFNIKQSKQIIYESHTQCFSCEGSIHSSRIIADIIESLEEIDEKERYEIFKKQYFNT